MLSTLALLFVVPQSKPVTIEVKATSSQVVLQKLGEAMGVKMIPGGSVAQDYIAISFNETPSDKVMAHIAATVNAQWERSPDGTYILNRTLAQERAEEVAATERLKGLFRERMAKFNNPETFTSQKAEELIQAAGKQAERLSEDQYWTQAWKLNEQMPGQRFLRRAIMLIGLEELAALPQGKRISYSFNPTRRQRRLPASLRTAAEQYIQELRIQIAAVDKLALTNDGNGRYVPLYQRPFDGHLEGLSFKIVATRAEMGYTSIALTITNGRGHTESVQETFSPDGENPSAGAPPKPSPYADLAKGLAQPLILDPKAVAISDEMRHMFGGRPAGTLGPPASSNIREMLLNMETADPLAYFVDPPVRQLAAARSKDMVALLPDMAMFGLIFELGEKGKTLEAIFASPILGSVVAITEEDGCLRIRPQDPVYSRKTRMPRTAVVQLCRALSASDSIDLDTMADFVGGTDEDLQVQMSLAFIASGIEAAEGLMNSISSGVNILRLYGKLSRSDRQKVKNGGLILNLNAVGPGIAAAVDKMIFDTEAELTRDLPQHDGPANPYMRYSMASPPDEGGRPFEKDPFVALGNGFPPGSQLRLRMSTPTHLFAKRSEQDRLLGSRAYSLSDLANQMAWEGTDEYKRQPYRQPPIDQFAMAQQMEIFADFDFRSAGFTQDVFVLPVISRATKFGPIDALPENIKNEFKKLLASAIENYKNVRFGGGGTTKPPPPALLR